MKLAEAQGMRKKAEFYREHMADADCCFCCDEDGPGLDPRHEWTDEQWREEFMKLGKMIVETFYILVFFFGLAVVMHSCNLYRQAVDTTVEQMFEDARRTGPRRLSI